MYYNIPYKIKQFFFVLIKLSIVVGAFYFIYSKLAKNENLQFNEFIAFLIKNNTFSFKNIAFLIILSVFNWFFEILKWQHLVKMIKKISFKTALEQRLSIKAGKNSYITLIYGKLFAAFLDNRGNFSTDIALG